jgi:small subunit ribosomal protein S20
VANHASAIKRNRQRIKKTDRNRAAKSALRTELKKARTAITGSAATSADLVKAAVSALDRAASGGTIPAKRASRVKGRLARALHKAKAAAH